MAQRYGRGLHDVDSVCIADFAIFGKRGIE